MRTARVRSIGGNDAKSVADVSVQVPILSEPWQIGIRPAALSLRNADPLTISRQIIASLLNPNLSGVSRTYDPVTNRPTFQFRALIEMVYWELADRLGHYQIRACRCGALFFASDAREKSHSTDCYRRFYMRDYRKGVRRRARKRKAKGNKK
jgi:hypothetical protein